MTYSSESDSEEVSIRAATLQDAAEIAEIYNQGIQGRAATFETGLRNEEEMCAWLHEHRRNHQPVLVAVLSPKMSESKLAGWASTSSYRPRSCYSGIGEFSVYVNNEHKRRGIGERLLLSLIEESRKLGYWKLVSRVFPFNIASRELCKKCGFREVGIYEKHGKLDGKWLDTVIVERLIPENLN